MSQNLFYLGLKNSLPIILGYIPVGIAYAVLATNAGFTSFETVLMSITVFAGAAQILAVGMVSQKATLLAIVIAVFLINARYLILSAYVYTKLRDIPWYKRLVSSFFVTDEDFAMFSLAKKEIATFPYLLGSMTVCYLSWVSGAVIGVFAYNILPESLSAALGIALYALFISLVVPRSRGHWYLALFMIATAIFNSILANYISLSWSVVISTLLFATIGASIFKQDKKKKV